MKIITYADDILLLVGAVRPPTAFKRIEGALDLLSSWASLYALEFSASKSQLMSIKGGLKPGYSVSFGTAPDAGRIESTATAKYLGVILDPNRSYWAHIEAISKKSKDMYRRLRALRSANWELSRTTARIIYKGVFLPRITYAAEAWKVSYKPEGAKQRTESPATGHYKRLQDGFYELPRSGCGHITTRPGNPSECQQTRTQGK
ncbi:unnamed protein product [Macrosiphum euphorbiae]|uniref:Reverse transcriptase domain-containing protein n=1 Tax=Macrosiphum euphorbiae TaxID=13131 RepID=A0AAV0XU76_9HEMI|nr:unnamed protein product [Macrosiphum euphorbiae]